MYTEPQIVSTDNLHNRAYVKVYINGERCRFYNGKGLGINCNPNHCKTIKERNRALSKLCFTIRKKLETGWIPSDKHEEIKHLDISKSTGSCIEELLEELKGYDISRLYKRDLESVGVAFVEYLKENNLYILPIDEIGGTVIEEFLKQFKHSSTYYMNKRRTLGAIFSRLVKRKANPVYETSRLKEKSTLHRAYTKQQLNAVLTVLEKEHSNLHLCALLMYGCFLRPHQEIRQLNRDDFNEACNAISLSGNHNKGGRVRTVPIPNYIQEVVFKMKLHELPVSANIFSRSPDCFNESYFNTAWSRIKAMMKKDDLIGDKHTLYSFRHTAAITLYMKTKDLYKVQQAMGHSSMAVTLTYMRSLGVVNGLTLEDIPDL